MKKVFKAGLHFGTTAVAMSNTGQVVHVAEQDGTICIWFETNTAVTQYDRKFTIIGTEHEIPANSIHRGSVLTEGEGGRFVWHIYELSSLS